MRGLLAALLIGGLTSCGHKPLDQQPGYADAHYQAQIYCSMVVPGSIYSDAMARCIHEQTVANMKHP